ncbi:MAG: hypothetical protein GY926_21805 [bacterium]|nr:hypothetical protein [bacterium]
MSYREVDAQVESLWPLLESLEVQVSDSGMLYSQSHANFDMIGVYQSKCLAGLVALAESGSALAKSATQKIPKLQEGVLQFRPRTDLGVACLVPATLMPSGALNRARRANNRAQRRWQKAWPWPMRPAKAEFQLARLHPVWASRHGDLAYTLRRSLTLSPSSRIDSFLLELDSALWSSQLPIGFAPTTMHPSWPGAAGEDWVGGVPAPRWQGYYLRWLAGLIHSGLAPETVQLPFFSHSSPRSWQLGRFQYTMLTDAEIRVVDSTLAPNSSGITVKL